MPSPFLDVRFFMGSLTNIGNTPFRRLVTELGAEGTVGEMALSDRVAKGWKQDQVLLRGHPCEPCFGAQVVGKHHDALIGAAQRAVEQGARFVDLNAACPLRAVVERGGGAALGKRPGAVARAIEALVASVGVPVTVKLRTGWTDDKPNLLECAAGAQEAGAAAIFVHGRSYEARYRGDADWELIAKLAASVRVPVIGSGDLLYGPQVLERLAQSGCAGVSIGRGGAIKPWLFREIRENRVLDLSSEERLVILARLVALSLETFGSDEIGRRRADKFLRLQLDFWTRYLPVGAIGREPGLQERFDDWTPRDELEGLMATRNAEAWTRLLQLAGMPGD